MAKKRATKTKATMLSEPFKAFVAKYVALGETKKRVRDPSSQGPLDRQARELIKIGIFLGGGLESAFKRQVRNAKKAGCKAPEIEQAILLGMRTVGFPRTITAWRWAHCDKANA